jgi:hypothetical protein
MSGRKLRSGARVRVGHGWAEGSGKVMNARAARQVGALAITLIAVLALGGVASAQAEPEPQGVPGPWVLRLNEEFSGSSLNTALWTAGWHHTGVSGPVSGDCLSSENVSQDGNGYLYLKLRKVSPNDYCEWEGQKASQTVIGGLVESDPGDGHGGFSYKEGYVEWRVYLPGVAKEGCPSGGCLPDWPALWSLPENHESEIDTLEGLGTLGQACFHLPPPFGSEAPGRCLVNSYAGWHTYGARWEGSTVTWYYDGVEVGQLGSSYLVQPQYLVMNIINPTHGEPEIYPDEMTVDYVRVWQHSTAPTVTTTAATNEAEEGATLNGTVDPNNAETKYHFEYGPTTAYGTSTPEANAGAGTTSIKVSAPITGLAEGTKYHFRLVATNADGTVPGGDQTFTTPFIHTTPVALREASTGYQWVYYTGNEHAVWEWTWNGSSWFNSKPGGFVAAGSNPAAVRSQSSGDAWDYYVGGGNGAIWQGAWNGKEETQTDIGGEVEAHTSPSVLREEATGNTWVNYVNKQEKEIWEWTWNGSSWFNSKPGGFVETGTSPVSVREAATGHQWIYYVGGGDDELWVAYWNGKEWTQTHIGGEVAENSSPAVVREEGTGYTWVDYVKKSDKSIREWTYNGSSWGESEQGGTAAANTSPTVSRETGTGYQWLFYVGSEGAVKQWTWNGSAWVSSSPGGSVAPGTSPAMVQPASSSYAQWIYYQGAEDPITQLSWTASSGWANLGL